MTKDELRKVLLNARTRITRRADKEREVARRTLTLLAETQSVLCYISMGSEVETRRLLKHLYKNGQLLFPLIYDSKWNMEAVFPRKITGILPDRIGNPSPEFYKKEVKEPIPDVVLTPLIGFNKELHRVGYGMGCFDKYFKRFPEVKKIGLAFDEQECDFAPEDNDIALDIIVTPTRIVYGVSGTN